MRLLFLGDSITQGVGASIYEKSYVSLVGQILNSEILNYGVSGTRIGRQTFVLNGATLWNYDFRLRAQIMEKYADKVFVFGGTNDYGHGRLCLGEVSKREENTFCNELRLLIEFLITKYDLEKICFILPTRRFDEDGVHCKGENGDLVGACLSEYVNAMRAILDEYGVDYIDLYKDGFPKPIADMGDEYTSDGVHPNDKGHFVIANKIIEYIKAKKEK